MEALNIYARWLKEEREQKKNQNKIGCFWKKPKVVACRAAKEVSSLRKNLFYPNPLIQANF